MSERPVSDSPRLMQFLTDEARDAGYVDLLLARADAAAQPGKARERSSEAAARILASAPSCRTRTAGMLPRPVINQHGLLNDHGAWRGWGERGGAEAGCPEANGRVHGWR